ncbi:hypothetical protein ACTXT7_002660 [Hymenolepis weldensis]
MICHWYLLFIHEQGDVTGKAPINWTKKSTSWQVIFRFCGDRLSSAFSSHFHLQRASSSSPRMALTRQWSEFASSLLDTLKSRNSQIVSFLYRFFSQIGGMQKISHGISMSRLCDIDHQLDSLIFLSVPP